MNHHSFMTDKDTLNVMAIEKVRCLNKSIDDLHNSTISQTLQNKALHPLSRAVSFSPITTIGATQPLNPH